MPNPECKHCGLLKSTIEACDPTDCTHDFGNQVSQHPVMNTPNKIVEAFREGVEEFDGNFPVEELSGGTQLSAKARYEYQLNGSIKSHHKHHTLQILRACLEEVGRDVDSAHRDYCNSYGIGKDKGTNTAKQKVRDVISEAIKQIEDE